MAVFSKKSKVQKDFIIFKIIACICL